MDSVFRRGQWPHCPLVVTIRSTQATKKVGGKRDASDVWQEPVQTGDPRSTSGVGRLSGPGRLISHLPARAGC